MKTKLILLCLIFSFYSQAQSNVNIVDSFEIDLWHSKADTTFYVNSTLTDINIRTNKESKKGTLNLKPNTFNLSENSLYSDTHFNAFNFLGKIELEYNNFGGYDKAPSLKTIYFVPENFKSGENPEKVEAAGDGVKGGDKAGDADGDKPDGAKGTPTKDISDLISQLKKKDKILYALSGLLILSLLGLAFSLYRNYRSNMLWKKKNNSNEGDPDGNGVDHDMAGGAANLFDNIKNFYSTTKDEGHFAFENIEQVMEFLSVAELSRKIDRGSTDKRKGILKKYGIDPDADDNNEGIPVETNHKFSALEQFKKGDDLLEILKKINNNAASEVYRLLESEHRLIHVEKAFLEGRDSSKSIEEDIKVLKALDNINSVDDISSFISSNVSNDLSSQFLSRQMKIEKLDSELELLRNRISSENNQFEQFKIMDQFNYEIIPEHKSILQSRNSLLNELRETQTYINQYFPKEEESSYKAKITRAFNYLLEKHEASKSYEGEIQFLEESRKYFNSLKNELELKVQEDKTEVGRSIIAKYILELAFHFKDFLQRGQSESSQNALNKKLMLSSPGNIQNFSAENFDTFSHNQNKFSKFLINLNVLITEMNPSDLNGVFIDGIYFEK